MGFRSTQICDTCGKERELPHGNIYEYDESGGWKVITGESRHMGGWTILCDECWSTFIAMVRTAAARRRRRT